MRDFCNKNVKLNSSIILCMITAAWLFLAMGGLFAAVFLFQRFPSRLSYERENYLVRTGKREIFTSTGYRYDKQFQHTLNRYRRFSALYNEKMSSPVPGLELTNVLGEGCSRMVPQGICIAGEYLLITAYDKGQQRGKASNSVLYVISNHNPGSRELLTTIVLPDVNHVGGVAFDGTNVWIAKSATRMCSRISFERIQRAAESGRESYGLSEYDQNVPCGTVASFVTFHDGRLWVGTYSNRISGKGRLRAFDIKKENNPEGCVYSLEKSQEIVIPGYANGVEFVENGNKTFMALTASRGRYFSSDLYLYEVVEDPNTGKNLYYQYHSAVFPPMAEELVSDGEHMYVLFESSASCYSASAYWNCIYPVDRICALSVQELFWQNQGGGYQKAASSVLKDRLACSYDVVYQERKYWRQCWG